MTYGVIAAVFLVLLLVRTPLFIALGVATSMCFALIQPPPFTGLMAQQMYFITEKSELLAIPFFVLAAVLMTHGKSARRVTAFVGACVRWMPGGMALATIVSCVFFAAMCGLTPTAVVAVGALMLPGLVNAGYPERFSLGLVTSSGSLGILVPPSLVVLVFVVVATSSVQGYNQAAQEVAIMRMQEDAARQAKLAEQQTAQEQEDDPAAEFMPAWAADVHEDLDTEEGKEIAEQKTPPPQAAAAAAPRQPTTPVNLKNAFLAGVMPVLLIAAMFSLYAIITGIRSGARRERFSLPELGRTARRGVLALVLPAIVIAVILTGRMTVIQAAALAAVYAFVLEVFLYRAVRLRDLPAVVREAGSMVGMILIILAVTMAFNYYLANELIIIDLTNWIQAHFHSRLGFLLAVNILLLFLGCLMDILSAVFITVPLLLPAALQLGIDPIHFGVIFLINFEIGYLTPPIGVNLFTAGAVFKKDLVQVSRSVLPFLGLLLVALALVTYFPGISLWMVRAFGG
jgi:C4-dicarboxylate transporter DctM subunit